MYYVKNKNYETVAKIMKKHSHPGAILFSDMASIYVTMANGNSRLAPLGIYHSWTNHSETMVHHKFRFLHTLNIEHEWLHLKRKFETLKFA